ncbi:type IV pilin protein [Acinetobacter beijerinckii]
MNKNKIQQLKDEDVMEDNLSHHAKMVESSATRLYPATRSIASRLAARLTVRRIASQGFHSCHYEHNSPSCAQTNFHFVDPRSGFTLIELMVVVMIVAILAAIAIPGYDAYIRRADLSTAQQEMLKIGALLEKHRSRNFSYDGFVLKGTATNQGAYYGIPNATDTTLLLPLNATNGSQKFTLSLNVASQTWSLKAVSQNPRNDSLLFTSTGKKCKTTTAASITNSSCGSHSEDW